VSAAATAGVPAGGSSLVLGRRQRLGDQLYGQILEQIVSGRLREGVRLPPEKEICRMFGVSRPIVRQALLRLRADGLVQARQGSGTFVMARPAARLADFAEPRLVAGYLRCLEVRIVLEGAAARYAAERRGQHELDRIVAAQAAFGAEVALGTMSPERDLAFHNSIVMATGNEFFPSVLGQIHEALGGFMSLSLRLTRTGSKSRAEQVLQEHAVILEAIAVQDADAAEIAMRYHIGQARRRMIDRNRDR
jgi:GntR family transcriptional regulator, transcriptional repressor for pyruvate dehydrogenase complex